MSIKWNGLAPIWSIKWGLRAPSPPQDFPGISPPNRTGSSMNYQNTTYKEWPTLTIRRSDHIPQRMLPSSAAYASDQRKSINQFLKRKIYL